ncbi:hypothetical protein RI129_005342 [Pyrocoelia pectoralis]|uniref:Uncharacterized protein n=1 Tax=Pyrocoelia pectoralis TaxID=417401 RepID=A0AAN7VKL3_9COLE
MLKFVLLLLLTSELLCQEEGYSFYKFNGPLSGPVQQIYVNGIHGPSVDYVAKPDYSYSYGVEDPKTGNSHSRHEARNGNSVSGEYTVLEADGSVRIVRYTADPETGFHASVNFRKS